MPIYNWFRKLAVGKKWIPSILIYHVRIFCAGDGVSVAQDEYFLTFRGAERFIEKNRRELAGLRWDIGGEQLWLW